MPTLSELQLIKGQRQRKEILCLGHNASKGWRATWCVARWARGPEPPPTSHHWLLVHLGDGCALVFGIIQDETTKHIEGKFSFKWLYLEISLSIYSKDRICFFWLHTTLITAGRCCTSHLAHFYLCRGHLPTDSQVTGETVMFTYALLMQWLRNAYLATIHFLVGVTWMNSYTVW